MTRHKKNRQEKIIADLRRQLSQTERKLPTRPSSILLAPQPQYAEYISPSKTVSIQISPYLLQDLIKTSLVTGAIVVGELGLLFLLKR